MTGKTFFVSGQVNPVRGFVKNDAWHGGRALPSTSVEAARTGLDPPFVCFRTGKTREVVLKKSTSPQIRQPILYISNIRLPPPPRTTPGERAPPSLAPEAARTG